MSLPVILLHGFPFDGAMWDRQAAHLRGRGVRVFAPDLGGFGTGAEKEKVEASMEEYAAEVHELIRHSCGGRAIVGGFSMGGYVLLALLRAHPGDVAGVMLIDTRAEADSAEGRANRLRSIEEIRARGTAGFVEGMIGRLVAPGTSAAVREEMRGRMLRQSPEAVMAAQSAMARRRDQVDLLGEIKVPVLLVVGSEDVVTPVACARGMHEKVAGSELVVVEGAGHMVPLERAEELARVMGEFVEGVG